MVMTKEDKEKLEESMKMHEREKKREEATDSFFKILFYLPRKGIRDLISFLQQNDFDYAPASTKHHQNWEGGLITHSYSVYWNLFDLNRQLGLDFDRHSISIVGLLHDVCKYDCYIIHDDNTITWNKDAKPGHGLKSVEIIERFIKLKEYEREAIMYHMGAYEQKEYTWDDLSKIYKKNPLAFYLHMADMQDTYEFEKQIEEMRDYERI